MPFDPHQPLPFLTAELPGLGGRIKDRPEDFEVEEIPAYEPCGQGEFLYLWIEKRDLGAEYFTRQLARRLGIHPNEVGMAGLKDRNAVTRQWVSVPVHAEANLDRLSGEGMQLLKTSRHTNKLRPGHLHGNRFRIRIREVDRSHLAERDDYQAQLLEPLLARLRARGLANCYGPQRFGRAGETLNLGLRLLRGEAQDSFRGGRFLRKLALSAAQSALFNHYLVRRIADGLLDQVLPGDVMAKWPFGGMFVAEEVATEQARFDRRETVSTGPIFGRKMYAAAGLAAEREAAVLRDAGLTPASFTGFGKLLQGTRRHNQVYVDDLTGNVEGPDVVLTFTLPAGSYATVLLREVMKTEPLAETV